MMGYAHWVEQILWNLREEDFISFIVLQEFVLISVAIFTRYSNWRVYKAYLMPTGIEFTMAFRKQLAPRSSIEFPACRKSYILSILTLTYPHFREVFLCTYSDCNTDWHIFLKIFS